MSTAFSQEQYAAIYPDGINYFYWNKARNHILKSTIEKYQLPTPILEVGAGRGAVIDYLKDYYPDIHGLELAHTIPYESVKNRVSTGVDATTHIHNNDSFKTLMLLDVIEHIEDPKSFIQAILANHPQIQSVLIAVPARQEIFSNYDEMCGHFMRYDFESAQALAQDLGMKIKGLSYFFHTLYVPARLLRFMKKDRATTILAPKSPVKKLLHNIIASYFRIEHALLPKKWRGSSLLFILEK